MIEQIDKNFALPQDAARPGLQYRNVTEVPFTVHGLLREDGKFVRLPRTVAEATSSGVAELNVCTAGGRVRFVTDSPYVAIYVKYNLILRMAHMTRSGSVGFDLYADDIYRGSYITTGKKDTFEAVVDLPEGGLHIITVHFPLYSGVDELYIGTAEGCTLEQAPDYAVARPVVYYGSSITQGGCASRPGNCYQNILSRLLDCDHVNLGFSGSAKGEDAMAQYIAGLDMGAFVLDYDNNSELEELTERHEAFFRTIRARQPETPVLMLSRPKYHLDAEEQTRLAVVRRTYENAVAAGDKNVYFIPGPDLIEERVREIATVDGDHPNDSGFVSMAYAMKPVLEKMLG